MKLLLVTLLAVLASAASLENEDPVEVVVNGLEEGQALNLGGVLDVKVKEHIDGEIVASNDPLHPFTAEGLAEIAANNPENIVDISPVLPEIPQFPEVPEIIEIQPVLPGPSAPIVVPEPSEPIVVVPEIPAPEVTPELAQPEIPESQPIVDLPIIAPEIVKPEEPIAQPEAQIPNGEVYNDGFVQVSVNAEEEGVLSTLQSWFGMVVNYFNGPEATSHQIV